MLLEILNFKLNQMKIKDTQLKVCIRTDATEIEEDYKWALERRKLYLADIIKNIREDIAILISTNLAGANELEHFLINKCLKDSEDIINKLSMQGKEFSLPVVLALVKI